MVIIFFEDTLTREVSPGTRDCRHVLQIIRLTLESGLEPCFFPIERICLAALSEISELLFSPDSRALERYSTAVSASSLLSFFLFLDFLLGATIFRPQRLLTAAFTDSPTSWIVPVPSIIVSRPRSSYQSPRGFVCPWYAWSRFLTVSSVSSFL